MFCRRRWDSKANTAVSGEHVGRYERGQAEQGATATKRAIDRISIRNLVSIFLSAPERKIHKVYCSCKERIPSHRLRSSDSGISAAAEMPESELLQRYLYAYMRPIHDPKKTDEIIGAALRTKKGVTPIYVSPGHLITLPESIEIVRQCVIKHRLPEPTRLAHVIVNEYRIRFTVSRAG